MPARNKENPVILDHESVGIFGKRISGEELRLYYGMNPLNPNLAVESVFHVLRTAFYPYFESWKINIFKVISSHHVVKITFLSDWLD